MSIASPPVPAATPAVATPPRPATPVWAGYAFTFANSLGSCVVTSSGLYFITKQGYHFSDVQNSLLAVLLGLMYIVGAKLAGRVPGWLGRLTGGMSHRAVLVVLMLTMAVLCTLPQIALWLRKPGEPLRAWPIWTVVLVYSPLTGVLWPIVESYLSGGRSGATLRRVMGRWNIVWSSAGAAATIILSPVVAKFPAGAVMSVGACHIAAALLLIFFSPEPAEHLEGEHEPHPPVYNQLLVTLRFLLPMGYAVSSALGPYLPHAARDLHVPEYLQAMLATAWLAPRVFTFVFMQRWQGWHGRWFLPVIGGIGLVASFAAAILSSRLPSGVGLAVMLISLACFGASMAIVYAAAIYYAMEVGKAEVDAGGTHEALIGTGYAVGPSFGLAAAIAVDRGALAPSSLEPVVLLSVLAVAILTAGVVVRRVAKVTAQT